MEEERDAIFLIAEILKFESERRIGRKNRKFENFGKNGKFREKKKKC